METSRPGPKGPALASECLLPDTTIQQWKKTLEKLNFCGGYASQEGKVIFFKARTRGTPSR